MEQNNTPKTMRTFFIIWAGQFISIIGSGLTGFGLAAWIFLQTGEATPFALTALFSNLPRVLLSPIAGSVADRYNRRRIMILADSAAALVTLGAAVLLFSGSLQVWHIYVIAFMGSVFGTFQEPAYRTSITMLVPKKDLARAGGIQQMGYALTSIITPMAAALLYAAIGLSGIMVIDFVTFFFAVGALLLVHIPQPKLTTKVEGEGEKPSMLRDAVFGWKFLVKRPGLFGLLWYYAAVNFFLSISGVLFGPLILSFANVEGMGMVQMVSGVAMLLGGILMSTWGGPKKRRIWGVVATIALSGVGYVMAGLLPSIILIAAGQFVILFFIPISSALSQVVWQTKVPADVQGRVFAIRAMIAYSIMPLSNLIAGPLADKVFNPLLAEGGALDGTFIASIMGTGPGRGIGLIFIVSAFCLWAVSLYAFVNPRIRNLETEIPDAIPDEVDEIEAVSDEVGAESADEAPVDEMAASPASD